MPSPEPLVLAVNPGSPSTKLGLFRGDEPLWSSNLLHDDDVLAEFRGRPTADQLDLRTRACEGALRERGVALAELAGAAGGDAFIVDRVSVDEWEPPARLSGVVGLDRESLSHALNTKAIAKRYARESGAGYA